jgi:hypothetical protein
MQSLSNRSLSVPAPVHQPAKIAWLTNPEEVVHRANEEAILQSAEPMGIKVERLYVRETSDFDRVFAAEALVVDIALSADVNPEDGFQQVCARCAFLALLL